MTTEPFDLPTGMFGYRRATVDQLLADRDVIERQLEGRLRAAEARIAQLETELDETRDELARRTQEFDEITSGGVASVHRFVNEEVGSLLSAAEQAADVIIRRAQRVADEQLAEVGRAVERMDRDIDEFSAWRDHAAPILRGAHSTLEHAREAVQGLPERLRELVATFEAAAGRIEEDVEGLLSLPLPRLADADVAPDGDGEADDGIADAPTADATAADAAFEEADPGTGDAFAEEPDADFEPDGFAAMFEDADRGDGDG